MGNETTAAVMRMERITRLLRELEYEVTRGMMEREIDETIGFRFVVSVSRSIPDGVVIAEFRTRPVHRLSAMAFGDIEGPKLKLVDG